MSKPTGVQSPIPPGSTSLFNSLRALRQRGFYASQAAIHGPIFKTSQFQNKVICIASLALAHRLFRDHSSSLTPSPQIFTKDLDGGFVRFMEPDLHRTYAPLFRRALSKPVIAPSTAVIRQLIGIHLSSPEPALLKLTHSILTKVLFGLEPGSQELSHFDRLFQPIAGRTMAQRLDPAALASLNQLRDWLRSNPIPDCSLAECSRLMGGRPDNTIIDNLLFMLRIATDDAAGLLRWILEFLARNPRWLDLVRTGEDPRLPGRIIRETLRLSRSEYIYRNITSEIEFENFRFPAGWLVRICVAECHRDPAHFNEPDTFNPDRFLGPQPTDQLYSPFGIREHSCSGAELASSISTLFIEALGGYDIQISGPAHPRRGLRHWMHWTPASTIFLKARS